MPILLLLACTSTSFPPTDTASNPPAGSTTDNAQITGAAFPDSLQPGEAATGIVTVVNTGTSTWTAADGYKLGAVGDSDPLYTSDSRVLLLPTDSVLPGGTHEFDIPIVGPSAPGAYVTDWQMVHESLQWFGDVASHEVNVAAANSDTGTPPDTGGGDNGGGGDSTAPSNPLDLPSAIVMNSPPDATTWPETATITTIDFNTDGVYINFTKRDGDDRWPDVPFGDGGNLEYTLWIALDIDGTWYTSGCIEYWYGLERNGGPPSGYAENWYYAADRWGAMTGYQPAVGEQVGFFLTAGDARNRSDDSGSIVLERTNVVMVPFPSDDGARYDY